MAKKSDVQLLGFWASPSSNKAQIALNLKSVDYEFIEENFYFSNKSDRLLEANPVHKQIPVLIHNHKPICESLIIIQYIDDVWTAHGPSILPSDPYHRAMARFWADYIDKKWFPLIKEAEKAEDEAKPLIMAKVMEGVVLLEAALAECGKGKEFFGGDEPGYVDVVLGSYLGWFRAIESIFGMKLFDEIKAPGLAKWAERFCAHDAAKDVVPQAPKLIEFYMMIQAAKKASA